MPVKFSSPKASKVIFTGLVKEIFATSTSCTKDSISSDESEIIFIKGEPAWAISPFLASTLITVPAIGDIKTVLYICD